MTIRQQLRFDCRLAGISVVLVRETTLLTGIGAETARHIEYGCSNEQGCPHAMASTCRVQRLRRQPAA